MRMFKGKSTFDLMAEDAIKLNDACRAALQICIDVDEDRTTAKTAVKDIQKIMVDLAFSLDLVDDK